MTGVDLPNGGTAWGGSVIADGEPMTQTGARRAASGAALFEAMLERRTGQLTTDQASNLPRVPDDEPAAGSVALPGTRIAHPSTHEAPVDGGPAHGDVSRAVSVGVASPREAFASPDAPTFVARGPSVPVLASASADRATPGSAVAPTGVRPSPPIQPLALAVTGGHRRTVALGLSPAPADGSNTVVRPTGTTTADETAVGVDDRAVTTTATSADAPPAPRHAAAPSVGGEQAGAPAESGSAVRATGARLPRPSQSHAPAAPRGTAMSVSRSESPSGADATSELSIRHTVGPASSSPDVPFAARTLAQALDIDGQGARHRPPAAGVPLRLGLRGSSDAGPAQVDPPEGTPPIRVAIESTTIPVLAARGVDRRPGPLLRRAAASSPNASVLAAAAAAASTARDGTGSRVLTDAIDHGALEPAPVPGPADESEQVGSPLDQRTGFTLKRYDELLRHLEAGSGLRRAGNGSASTAVAVTGGSTSPTAAAPGAADVPGLPARFEPSEVAQQLIRTIRLHWQNGGGEARLRLHPQHLGEVTVAVQVRHGVVAAVLSAESEVVRGWIRAHQEELKAALAAQGLHLGKLVVEDEPRRGRSPWQEPEPPQRRAPRRQSHAARFEVHV